MNVVVLIHGVPHGFDLCSVPYEDDRERAYFETFYGITRDYTHPFMRIDVKGTMCYYHYLIGNIKDNGYRPGSYIGITIGNDSGECFSDVVSMYRILDNIYQTYIKRDLFNSDGLSYSVGSFSQYKSTLNNILNEEVLPALRRQIQSFIRLGSVAKQRCPKLNLYDYTNDELVTLLKKYGNLDISPQFPSKQEIERGGALKREIENLRRQIQVLGQTEVTLQNDIRVRDSRIASLEKEVRCKEDEVARLNKELDRREMYKTTQQLISEVKVSLTRLGRILSQLEPGNGDRVPPGGGKDGDDSRKSWKNSLKNREYLCLVIVILVLLLGMIFLSFHKSDQGQVISKIESLRNQCTTLTEKVEKLERTVSTSTGRSSDNNRGSTEANMAAHKPSTDRLKIDINGYNGFGPLKKGNTYTAQLKGYTGNNNDVSWILDGCIQSEGNGLTIRFTPDDSIINIECRIRGEVVKGRNLTAN